MSIANAISKTSRSSSIHPQRSEPHQSSTVSTMTACQRALPPTSTAGPSNQEILKWTLTSDAIATCFIRDVLSLRDNGPQLHGTSETAGGTDQVTRMVSVTDADFFWLGRVPCRMVRILGMVVGLQVYEARIVYTGRLAFCSG